MQFEIEPLVGVGPVRFDMTRADVYAVLGTPEYKNGNRECFLSGLMVDFDEAGAVEFVELANSEKFTATFHRQDLHTIPANDAVTLLSKYGKFKDDDPELGHSYIFPDLQMSLWRSTVQDDENDEDGKYFEAIGIARPGYFGV
jgi:hypothetical protein